MEAATDGRELLKGQGAKLLKIFSKTKQKLMFFTAVIVWIFSQSNSDFEILRWLPLSDLKTQIRPQDLPQNSRVSVANRIVLDDIFCKLF